jgi:hypothetical protein
MRSQDKQRLAPLVSIHSSSIRVGSALLAILCSLLSINSNANVFRCVDQNGVSTYSDEPCAPKSPPPAAAEGTPAKDSGGQTRRGEPPIVAPVESRALTPRELKARQILVMLRLTLDSGVGVEANQRIVDMVAPDLVKHLDPTNGNWNPQNGRWHSVLEFVKADLRKDVAPALRASNEQISQAIAREYAARSQDADLDALSQYLNSPEGGHYVAFQNVVRSITYQSLRELLDQEPVTVELPSDVVLKRRQNLLGTTSPGSTAVLENTARREGTALDALYLEYESYVPNFTAFSQSITAKRFFVAAEPAYRTAMALTSTTAGGFADVEEFKYVERWQAFYGPPLRNGRSTTVVMRNRYGGSTVSVSTTTRGPFNAKGGSAESMAIQCEQREDSTTRRGADANAQAAAQRAIQNRCRAEQNLAPY